MSLRLKGQQLLLPPSIAVNTSKLVDRVIVGR
jgi:hypothetical protein